MRPLLILAPLLIVAAPAGAQPGPAHSAAQATAEIERALDDPRTLDRVTKSIQAMTDAFLKLPVGDIEAAIEGRPATAADKRRTVRDMGDVDPAEIKRQIADARPMIDQSVKALKESLPALIKSFDEAGKAIERARANMPTPGYPKR